MLLVQISCVLIIATHAQNCQPPQVYSTRSEECEELNNCAPDEELDTETNECTKYVPPQDHRGGFTMFMN